MDYECRPCFYVCISFFIKEKECYVELLNFIKETVGATPELFLSDFEQSMLSACSETMPDTSRSACFFHLKQAVRRQEQLMINPYFKVFWRMQFEIRGG